MQSAAIRIQRETPTMRTISDACDQPAQVGGWLSPLFGVDADGVWRALLTSAREPEHINCEHDYDGHGHVPPQESGEHAS